MKKLIMSLVLIISFFVMSGFVKAQLTPDDPVPHTVTWKAENVSVGKTFRIPSTDLGSGHKLDVEICNNYLENETDAEDTFIIMWIDNKCYVTPLVNDEDMVFVYEDSWNPDNGLLQAEDNFPNTGIGNFLNQEDLSLPRVVYEINKGSLAQKFKTEYNLKSIKAAYVGNSLYIQYVPRGETEITTLKIAYSKNGQNNSISSSTIGVSNITTNLLEQFPFWMLEAAKPTYETDLKNHTKEEILAAFNEITNYSYTKNGSNYTLSATVPDNINSLVLAVFSSFLDDTPIGDYIEEQSSPSSSGQSNTSVGKTNATDSGESKTTTKKTKNPNTGAALSIKILLISFVLASIAFYFCYRSNKIKKI